MPLRPPAGFILPGYNPLKVPDAPTGASATSSDGQATVSFTAPSNIGGAAITAYYAVSNPSQFTATAASSPITVTGLTNGTSYTFTVWALNSFGPSPYSSSSGSVTPTATRGLFGGGSGASNSNIIDYITISTTGNATDFGDLTVSTSGGPAGCSSSTRGLFGGGRTTNTIGYVTIASTGNATTFGQLTPSYVGYTSALSNSTRGVWAGGVDSFGTGARLNIIQYVTIATTGNATDFGDLTGIVGGLQLCAATASPTRGLIAGGNDDSTQKNVINYITIATTGNATDFGDLTSARDGLSACSSDTRALFGGGIQSITTINTIEYVTIATTGNATDFGDLTVARRYLAACSSPTRGTFGGGDTGTDSNVIDYVTIATIGNATDFGDLTLARSNLGACSNGHGGLA